MAQDLSDMLISYFLNTPDEVLITEIFPRFPLNILNKLCSLNIRFSNICSDDTLWQLKTSNEFPELMTQKPTDSSWNDYYRFIVNSRLIPIIYDGDRINYAQFNSDYLNITISLLLPYIILLKGTINIVFINKQSVPIIVVQYPAASIDIKSQDFNSIEKVVIFIDENYNKSTIITPILPSLPSRGRKSVSIKSTKLINTKEENVDADILYKNLTSINGHPPIYGTVDNYGHSRIIDKTNIDTTIGDQRKVVRGKVCDTYRKQDLIDILWNIVINKIPGELPIKQEFYDKWNQYNRSYLC
jgi:hypothetical protein